MFDVRRACVSCTRSAEVARVLARVLRRGAPEKWETGPLYFHDVFYRRAETYAYARVPNTYSSEYH